jgi:hypothetical protein
MSTLTIMIISSEFYVNTREGDSSIMLVFMLFLGSCLLVASMDYVLIYLAFE